MYSCKLKPAEHNFYPTTQYNLLPQTTSLHFGDTYYSSDSATLHSSTSAFTYRPTLITGNPVARIVMYISAKQGYVKLYVFVLCCSFMLT